MAGYNQTIKAAKKIAASALSSKDSIGREVWRVDTSDGKQRTLVTKKSAAAAMDRAAKRYSGALERLAKR